MDEAVAQNIMMKFNGWRKAGINCDVTLFIGGQEFHAHKNILAAATGYFEKLFTDHFDEKGKNTITLKNVDPDGFRLILDYIYTGEIKIDNDIFGQVLPLAVYYQIECLVEMLFYYVKNNISINNGFYYYHSVGSVEIRRIIEFTKEFIRNNFLSCSDSAAFFNVTYPVLLEFIDSPVEDELDRFKIIMKWIQYDSDKRSDYLSDLIKHVRFACISTHAIFYDILGYQLVMNNLEMIKAIRERRKMEQTVRIHGMKGSDLIGVDIFNAKLEATNVIAETDVDYEKFQISSSVDAIYISTFRYGTGNKLYRFKDPEWTLLDDSVYNPNVPYRSIVYSEEYKTIYAYNKLCLYSYNCESKSYVDGFVGDHEDDYMRQICGSLVSYRGLIYMIVECKYKNYCMYRYDPRDKSLKFLMDCRLSDYCLNSAVCAVLGEQMFIVNDGAVHLYNIKENTCTVIRQKAQNGISYHSLIGYQNQLYAIRKEWDVIDVFDLTKKKWTKTIHLR